MTILSLVMNIFAKEVNQLFLFLLLVFNKPGSCPLSKELHQAPLDHDPEHPGQVEDHSQKNEVERHPLVVRVVNYGGSSHVLILDIIVRLYRMRFHEMRLNGKRIYMR